MSIIIGTVGVVVQGSVTRKYDSVEDQTTLDVTFEQAQELHDSLGTVLKFFAETGNSNSGEKFSLPATDRPPAGGVLGNA